MKIVSVLGSPNKNGNTAVLLDSYLDGIKDNNKVHEFQNIFLQEKTIKPCTGCDYCKKNKGKLCIIQDDMKEYYDLILEADLIIFATPVYWFSMTAQLKTFIDRLYALDFKTFPKDKKLTLLTTYGDDTESTSGTLNVSKCILDACNFLDINFIHDYRVSSAIPVSENNNALRDAFRLGKSI